MARPPAPQVAAWIQARPFDSLCTVSICQAEILAGIAILAPGRRRSALESAAHAVFTQDFAGRVLPFDGEAAVAYAQIFAIRKQAGRPIAPMDLIIAAVARSKGASVVMRDVGGFERCGVALVNPWEAA